MKTYKEYDKVYIGESDIASLILAGYKEGVGLSLSELHFGIDGGYQAYITDDQAEIGSHYELVQTFQVWLKIYDDSGLTAELNGEEIQRQTGLRSGHQSAKRVTYGLLRKISNRLKKRRNRTWNLKGE